MCVCVCVCVWVCVCVCVPTAQYNRSDFFRIIKIGAAFTKTEINNEWNVNFLQSSSLVIQCINFNEFSTSRSTSVITFLISGEVAASDIFSVFHVLKSYRWILLAKRKLLEDISSSSSSCHAARTDFPNSLSRSLSPLSLFLTIHHYPPSFPAGLPGYILCPYRTVVDKL